MAAVPTPHDPRPRATAPGQNDTRLDTLHTQGPTWWRDWNGAALAAACGPGVEAGVPAPELHRWRALAAFMTEGDDALFHLDAAWHGHIAAGESEQADLCAQMALVFSLVDSGAASHTRQWLARTATTALPWWTAAAEGAAEALWLNLGQVARVALGEPDGPGAVQAAQWLDGQLRLPAAAQTLLSPHQRLLCALLLLEYRFATQRFDQILLLCSLVEAPALFAPATPLLRARWALMVGYSHHLIGDLADARRAWQAALDLAQREGCPTVQLQARLALARQLLDAGGLADAQAQLDALQPAWGAGRVAQLIQWLQLRAQLLMLRDQPQRAQAQLQDALRLADEAGWVEAEQSALRSLQAQALVALDQCDEAAALLARLAGARQGREAAIFAAMGGLVRAWQQRDRPTGEHRHLLAEALAMARQARMTMFFRRLPGLAGQVCWLALRWQVPEPEAAFVREVIQARNLPAPEDADQRWPWPLWLGLCGPFEWFRAGQRQHSSGKAQQKPLELLRLLGCERSGAIGLAAAARALWPEAEGDADLRNLDVTIHRLRKLLGDASLVWVHDNRVGLDPTHVGCDLRLRRREIERLGRCALQPAIDADSQATRRTASTAAITAVVALTRGDLLADAPDTAWLQSARAVYRQDTVRAALAAATVLAQSPADGAERGLLEAALAIEPLATSLVQRLVLCYQQAGLSGDAVRLLDRHARLLAEAGAAPDAGLLRWRARLLAGGPLA